jgi:hypothetical protein
MVRHVGAVCQRASGLTRGHCAGCSGALISLLLALLATAAVCAPGKGIVKPDTSAAKPDGNPSARDRAWSHGSGKAEQSAWLKNKLGMTLWAADQDAARASFAATQATFEKKTQALAAATAADVRAQANIADLEKSMAAAAHANQLERADGLKKQRLAAQFASGKLSAARKTATTEHAAAEKRFVSEQRQLASLEATISALELHAANLRLLITEVRLRLAHMNAKHSMNATEFLDTLTWQTQEATLKTEKTELMARYGLSDPALTLQTTASSSTNAYEIEFKELHDVLWAYFGTSAKGHRLKATRNRQYWLAYFGLQTESQELDKLAALAINAERDLLVIEQKEVAKELEFLAASKKRIDLRVKELHAAGKKQFKLAVALKDKTSEAEKVLDILSIELLDAKAQSEAATTMSTLLAKRLAKHDELLEVLELVCARFTRDALSETIALSETAQKEAHDTQSWALAAKPEAASKASRVTMDKLMKAYIFANKVGDKALPDAAARSGAAVRNSEL